MKALQNYYLTCKILATVALVSQGLYQSIVSPGPKDFVNASICGLCCYCIWFCKMREK